MLNRRRLLTSAVALASVASFVRPRKAKADRAANMHITLISHFQVMRFVDVDTVELLNGKDLGTVRIGDVFHDHALVAILQDNCVILEDCRTIDGHMLIVNKIGVRYDLNRTAESTTGTYSQNFSSLRAQDVQVRSLDPLGDTIMAKTGNSQEGDPHYDTVAAVFPPI